MKNGKVVSLAVVGLLSTTALVGCNKGNDEALAKEILSKISIGDAYMQPNGDFSVPNKILHEDQTYEIVWTEVEDSPYVSIEAVEGEDFNNIKITIPAAGEADADYAIKATVKVGDKSASQEFEGTIIADALINKVYTDASEFYDDIKAEKIDPFYDAASFEGIVSRKYYFNYYLTDAEGDSVVVNHKNDKIKVGDKVKVKGKYSSYYTMNQFKSDNISETVVSSGNTVPELRYYADNKTKAYNATELLAVPHEKGSLIHGQRVKVTGIVEDDGQGITLRDPTNLDEKIIMTKDGFDRSKPEEKQAILDATKGKIATFDAIYYCHHDKVGEGVQPYVLYDDAREADKIPAATELTPELEKAYNIKLHKIPSVVCSNLPVEWAFITDDTQKYDLTYEAVAVNDVVYITADGKVTVPHEPVTIPTLKVKFTNKVNPEDTFEKTYENVVVGIEYTSLETILNDKDGDMNYYVKGYVVSCVNNNKDESKNYSVIYQDGKYYCVYHKTTVLTPKHEVSLNVYWNNSSKCIQLKETIDDKETTTEHVIDSSKVVDVDGSKISAFKKANNKFDNAENVAADPEVSKVVDAYNTGKVIAIDLVVTEFKSHLQVRDKQYDYSVKITMSNELEAELLDGKKLNDKIKVYAAVGKLNSTSVQLSYIGLVPTAE